MNALRSIFNRESEPANPKNDLNEILQTTRKYGKCRVSMQDNGWYCCIAMNTNTTGTSFEVKSEFDHPTPIEAVKTCLERMHTALRILSA